jgi:Protein of unknown function (DUF1403)
MVRTPQKPAAETLPLPPMPGWARLDTPVADMNEAAFRAGAALAMLDGRARAGVQVPFDGVWRRRLALKAAAASARIAPGDAARCVFPAPWRRRSRAGGTHPGGPGAASIAPGSVLNRHEALPQNMNRFVNSPVIDVHLIRER